jgi:polyhydroxybutyrate depolymerase
MHIIIAVLICFTLLSPAPAQAERETIRDRIQEWRETREHRQANKQDIDADNTKGANIEQFHGREILVYVPQDLKPAGTRAMVMVFHGGGGNAGHIRKNLELDKTADQYGFIVAYLNGTQAMRIKINSKSWNGGGKCCGKAFENNIDDVGYIENAAHFLSEKYGIRMAVS